MKFRITCINTDEGQKEKIISICKHYNIKGASTECVIILFIKRIMLHTYTRRKKTKICCTFQWYRHFSLENTHNKRNSYLFITERKKKYEKSSSISVCQSIQRRQQTTSSLYWNKRKINFPFFCFV